jgi:hypothetical protein
VSNSFISVSGDELQVTSLFLFFLMCLLLPTHRQVQRVVVTIGHSDTRSVRLPWTSERHVAATSTRQHTTIATVRHPCPRVVSKPQSQQVIGRRNTSFTARPTGSAGLFLSYVHRVLILLPYYA